MNILIRTLFKSIWRIIDVLLYISGVGCIVTACFLCNLIAGLVSLGIALLVTCTIIEFLPNSQEGGD